MIKIDKIEVFGWEAAIRGMRNPLNSHDKSDSEFVPWDNTSFKLGENDLKLMLSLSKAGSDHSKYLRMINVTADITAPLYYWKEYDTYKIGTVANSESTMHTIHKKEFMLDDFSHEHLLNSSVCSLEETIEKLNFWREKYIIQSNDETRNESAVSAKICWWQMIQLLPSSFNQKRTVQLNYQVLKNIYHARKNHKLDEWRDFCKWIESLPYSEIIALNAGV